MIDQLIVKQFHLKEFFTEAEQHIEVATSADKKADKPSAKRNSNDNKEPLNKGVAVRV